MRVLTVIGARPQFVKAAPVSRVLRQRHEELLVHTGQHYDDAMSADFFAELELPDPDVNLEVGSGSHAAQTGEMLRRLEPIAIGNRPDVILAYGDTNSTLAAAVVGAKLAYPNGTRPWLVHVEAGLRSFRPEMPEERNRVVADHLSDLLLAPSAAAMANLEREGLADRAELVGDVMVDAHAWAVERAGSHLPEEARGLDGYLLLTLHRAQNVDDPGRLRDWIAALRDRGPVVFPVHPRTRAAMEAHGVALPGNVRAMRPVGFLEMIALERHARAVLTDSGGVQKEAYLSGVPCLTLRGETEWTETVDAGWNRVVPTPLELARALDDTGFMARDRPRPVVYGDGRAAERIVAALARRHEEATPPRGLDRAPQQAPAS
jgi:UDP-GlcNAc3NAcA epimerase